MLRAEIGPQRRPPPLTAEVEEVGLQMFHVEPMGRRGVRTVALVTCSGVGVGTTADFCLQHEAGVPTPMPGRPCTPLNAVNLQASPQGVLPADVAEPDCPARTSKPGAGERGRPTQGASCCEQKSAPSAGRSRSPKRLRKRGPAVSCGTVGQRKCLLRTVAFVTHSNAGTPLNLPEHRRG